MEAGPSANPVDGYPPTEPAHSSLATPVLVGSIALEASLSSPTVAEAPRVPEKPSSRRQMVFTEKTCLNGKRYRVFTAEEVRRHSTPDDCWLIACQLVESGP